MGRWTILLLLYVHPMRPNEMLNPTDDHKYFDVNAKSNDGKASKSASLATAVIIALSAFGSMLSVAYTGVRGTVTITPEFIS